MEGKQNQPVNAENIIYGIRDEVLRMGANDSEASRFDRVLGRLRSGASTPEDAVREARAILDGKQDYH
ncbi:MAG: hypothetical protein WC609_02790 [Candidatus Paceibacterota bacterium]